MDEPKLALAWLLTTNGERGAAIRLDDELIRDHRVDARAYLVYHGLGLASEFNGDFDGAVADLELAQDLHPGWFSRWYDLWKAYLTVGVNGEARAEARRLSDLGGGGD